MRWLSRACVALALVALLPGTAAAPAPPDPAIPTASAPTTAAFPTGLMPILATTLARDAGDAYLPTAIPDGVVAANPAQRLTATFLADGVHLGGTDPVPTSSAGWGMRLTALGYGENLQPVAPALPAISAGRVVYARGATTEWYINAPLGIEQGFTLAAPPAGRGVGDLTLAIGFDGVDNLTADRGNVAFIVPGVGRLRYGQLSVTDATGRALPASFAPTDGGVRIVVDDRGAVYPVTVDPVVQTGKLTASDAATGDGFGFAVALNGAGTVALIGALGRNGNIGAAYVFTRSGTIWTQQQRLTAGDGAPNDFYGGAVALSGDGSIALIGADRNAGGIGAAYAYTRSGNTWGAEQKITAAVGTVNDAFGFEVALSTDGSTALIGAVGCTCSAGAAYVYTRTGGVWGSEQKITPSDSATGDGFGSAVALNTDGTLALIGADSNTGGAGAAYGFARTGGVWGAEQKLTPTDSTPGDDFGFAVTLSRDGSRAIVGAPGCSCSTGAAYAYTRSGGSLGGEQKLTASDAAAGDGFGDAVALSGDGAKAAIGSFARVGGNGAAYLFAHPGPTWAELERLSLLNAAVGDEYGNAVAMTTDGSMTLIGAPGTAAGTGAAYVFPAGLVVTPLAGTTPQSAAVGTPFATALAVHVTDTLTGAPLANTAVQFIAPPVGASGTFAGSATANVIADGNGDATAPAFTANATNGSYQVSVAVGGAMPPQFNLTNLPGSATRIAVATGGAQSAPISTAFGETMSAVVLDASGNGLGGVAVTFTAPASGASGTFQGGGATANVTTNSNGVAIAPAFTANAVAGAYTLTATATGASVPARFNLTNTPGAATHFALAIPATARVQLPVPFTVTALDAGNNVVTGYAGTVTFTSNDGAATLPGAYLFQPGDKGVHSFTVTFGTIGSRSVTATESGQPAVTGSQNVAVTPAITGISPTTGPATGGTLVTITGIGLGGATGVTVGGLACTNPQVNGPGTSITCTLPVNHAAGTVDVVVTTPNGAATFFHGYTFMPVSAAPAPVGRNGGGGGGTPSRPVPGGRP